MSRHPAGTPLHRHATFQRKSRINFFCPPCNFPLPTVFCRIRKICMNNADRGSSHTSLFSGDHHERNSFRIGFNVFKVNPVYRPGIGKRRVLFADLLIGNDNVFLSRALGKRYELLIIRSSVICTGPDNLAISTLFNHMCTPAGNTTHHKQRRKHGGRNAHQVISHR